MMRQAGRLIHHYRVLKLLWIAMLTIGLEITRFSELRQHSRDMSSWLYHQQEKVRGIDDPNAKLLFQRLGHFANDLRGCGSQLLFKHYYTQDSYRLAHMRSCRRHMLCRFCSSIRATKQAMSYHAKMLQVLKDNPKLKPVFYHFNCQEW